MVLRAVARHPRAVRFCGPRLLVSLCLVAAAVAAVLALALKASGASHDQTPCTWGASSVSAENVNGKDVVSPVATSGCVSK